MSARLTGVSPAVIAQGLIASCRHYNFPPTEVMSPGRGATVRTALGGAIIALVPKRGAKDGLSLAVAHMLQLNPTNLSPAGLRMRDIGPDLLLDLAEALKAAGFDPAAVTVTRNRANAAAPKPPREPKPPKAPKPAVAKPTRPAPKAKTVAPAPRPKPVVEPNAPVIHVRPMKANLRRWTRQFLNAGWTPREVAKLFDLHPAQVKAEAVELQRV